MLGLKTKLAGTFPLLVVLFLCETSAAFGICWPVDFIRNFIPALFDLW